MEPLVDYDQRPHPFVELLAVRGDEASDVDESVFLGAHGAALAVGHHLEQDLPHRPFLVARLPLLDEVGVLHSAGGVEDDGDSVPRAQLVHRFQVLHGEGLPPRHVHAWSQRRVGDPFGAGLVNQLLQLLQVHVAFERMLARGVVGLSDDHVHKNSTRALDVLAGGGEVHVHGDVLAGTDANLGGQVFCAPPLVGRHHMSETVHLLDRLLQGVEVAAAGVGLVAQHQTGPLIVAHRRCPAVGQEIDVDVLAPQEEGVVAGLGDGLSPFLSRRQVKRLDRFDLVRLSDSTVHCARSSSN